MCKEGGKGMMGGWEGGIGGGFVGWGGREGGGLPFVLPLKGGGWNLEGI